jgi:nucleotide-binding universal stress UspA family protein
MGKWKEVLCALDFSEPSRLAMLEACDLAKRDGARLTLVHVLELPAGRLSARDLLAPGSPKLVEMTHELERKLETWRAEAERLVEAPVAARVLPGEPGAEIPRLAGEEGFDLVVVATHGGHGMKRLLMGSVAERVVREAPCSVLVARPMGEARAAERDR